MDKESLQNEIENYIHYYYGIKKSFDIYKYIKENSEIYPEETHQIAFFLNPILVSLLNSTLMDMSKILDCRNQKNVNKLIERCIANAKLFCNDPNSIKEKNEKLELFKEIKEKLENNNVVIEKLNTYRDVYLAHTDKDYFMDPKKLFEEYKTTYEDIERVLKLIVDLLNKILYSLCETTYAFDDEYKRDYKYILECIKEHRDNQLSKYRKQE